MMIARWQIDARFGHKQTVIDTLRAWEKDIAPQIGLSPAKRRMLTGSVGARGGTVITAWGGGGPWGPTVPPAACNVPSGWRCAAMMNILAPGLSSPFSPATYLTMIASGGTMIFFSSFLYFTMSVWPSGPATVVSPAALVIIVPRRDSQGKWPSATPRKAAGRRWTGG